MLTLGRNPLFLLLVSAVSVLMVGQAAFAAANTVPASSAGAGSEVVSGFTITNVIYNLNAGTPTNVDVVTFTATADNGSTNTGIAIRSRFVSGGSWYTCARIGGVAPAHSISCDTDAAPGPQLTAAPIDVLEVVIVQQ